MENRQKSKSAIIINSDGDFDEAKMNSDGKRERRRENETGIDRNDHFVKLEKEREEVIETDSISESTAKSLLSNAGMKEMTSIEEIERKQTSNTNEYSTISSLQSNLHEDDHMESKSHTPWQGEKVRFFGKHPFYVDDTPLPSYTLPNPAIVILACRRKERVITTLDRLQQLPFINEFDQYVSVGCPEEPITWEFAHPSVRVLHYQDPPSTKGIPKLYLRIQLHYQFLLKELFEKRQHSHVIVLEDDFSLSTDLLYYFKQTAALLEADSSLVCVSAFNDHAKGENENPILLKRSSSFPNLALLFSKRSYELLWKDQPLDDTTNGWDHWLRVRAASLHVECVYPVLPRIRHIIAEKSSTTTKAFSKRLASYPMAEDNLIDLGDLSYLRKENYDHSLLRMVVHPDDLQETYERMQESYRHALGTKTSLPSKCPRLQATNVEEKEVVIIDGRKGKNVSNVKRYNNRVILLSTLREVGVNYYARMSINDV